MEVVQPAVEVLAARKWIRAVRARRDVMFAVVVQHVAQRVDDLAQVVEDPLVEALREDAAFAFPVFV